MQKFEQLQKLTYLSVIDGKTILHLGLFFSSFYGFIYLVGTNLGLVKFPKRLNWLQTKLHNFFFICFFFLQKLHQCNTTINTIKYLSRIKSLVRKPKD